MRIRLIKPVKIGEEPHEPDDQLVVDDVDGQWLIDHGLAVLDEKPRKRDVEPTDLR